MAAVKLSRYLVDDHVQKVFCVQFRGANVTDLVYDLQVLDAALRLLEQPGVGDGHRGARLEILDDPTDPAGEKAWLLGLQAENPDRLPFKVKGIGNIRTQSPQNLQIRFSRQRPLPGHNMRVRLSIIGNVGLARAGYTNTRGVIPIDGQGLVQN